MRPLTAALSAAVVFQAIAAVALLSTLEPAEPERTAYHTPLHFPAASSTAMSKVAVVGSTGSVGRATVHSLASHPSVASVTAITRRQYFKTAATPTVHEHIVPDMFSLQPSDFQQAQTVFCCLGTTRAQAGGAEQFRHLDHDLIVLVAQKAREAGVSSFHLVSSWGANADSSMLYTQSKGQTEAVVAALGFEQLGIWRPGFLDTANYPREHQKLGERMAMSVVKLLAPLIGRHGLSHIAVEQVADAMIKDSLSARKGANIYDGSPTIKDFLAEGQEK